MDTVMLTERPPPLPPRSQTLRMEFVGTPAESRGILVKGALLTLPTAGFYRFWLLTRLRRFLWQGTRIGQDHFDYLGTARELLLGFFIAVAILAPVYILYFLIGLESERMRAFASSPLVFFFVLFGRYALFRARRYRLTRTAFRGVRFSMEGSGFRYVMMWLGWSILSLITLGLAYPWQVASLERYKVDRTRWGNLQARLETTGWDLFRQGIGLWAAGMVLIVLGGAAIAVRARDHWDLYMSPVGASSLGGPGWMVDAPIFGVMAMGAMVLFGLLYLFYVGVEWRWWLNGLRLGDLRVASNLPRRVWLVRTLILWGLCILLMIGAGVIAGIGAFALSKVAAQQPMAVGFLGGAYYLAFVLALGVVYRQVMVCGFWRQVVNSIELTGIGALDTAGASGQAAGMLAEGFAEALDLGAF